MAEIHFDFSKLPSDVALFLGQQTFTDDLAKGLAAAMGLDYEQMSTFRDSLVGAVARVVDDYLP